jgi:hypothetical protein
MDKVKASQKKRDSRGLKSKKGKGWKCKELMMKIDWYVKAFVICTNQNVKESFDLKMNNQGLNDGNAQTCVPFELEMM